MTISKISSKGGRIHACISKELLANLKWKKREDLQNVKRGTGDLGGI